MIASCDGQAGAIEEYKGRGVWVPHGLKACWIMEGAAVLENHHEITPFISRAMVRDVLLAVLPLVSASDISELSHVELPAGSGAD